jgi:hypothetical protein
MDRAGGWISGKGYMTSKERRAIAKDKSQAKLDKVYAGADMPDSELIRRNERRKAAGRRGSRMRNVLTEDLLG